MNQMPEYREGPEAKENFERGMKALFKYQSQPSFAQECKKQASTLRNRNAPTRIRRGFPLPASLSFRGRGDFVLACEFRVVSRFLQPES